MQPPRAVCASPEEILSFLSTRQFVRPHRSVADVMDELHTTTGACEVAINRAINWLDLNASTKIGRLRRSELMQLARSVHRFWRVALHQPA